MQDPFQNLLPDWKLINDNSTVFLFVVLVVPGIIIVFVRSQFKAGRVPSYPAGFLSYLATSTVYWAFLIFLIVPIVEFVAPVIRSHGLWWESFTYFTNPIKYFGAFILIVLLPAIIGICFGYNQQIYDIDEPDNWKPMDHSILIAGGEISSIEFWPLTDSGERANEKDQ